MSLLLSAIASILPSITDRSGLSRQGKFCWVFSFCGVYCISLSSSFLFVLCYLNSTIKLLFGLGENLLLSISLTLISFPLSYVISLLLPLLITFFPTDKKDGTSISTASLFFMPSIVIALPFYTYDRCKSYTCVLSVTFASTTIALVAHIFCYTFSSVDINVCSDHGNIFYFYFICNVTSYAYMRDGEDGCGDEGGYGSVEGISYLLKDCSVLLLLFSV